MISILADSATSSFRGFLSVSIFILHRFQYTFWGFYSLGEMHVLFFSMSKSFLTIKSIHFNLQYVLNAEKMLSFLVTKLFPFVLKFDVIVLQSNFQPFELLWQYPYFKRINPTTRVYLKMADVLDLQEEGIGDEFEVDDEGDRKKQ